MPAGSSNYPTTLDTTANLPDVSGANLADANPLLLHSNQHDTVSQAVIALEAKLGIGSETAGAAATGEVLKKKSDGSTGWEAETNTIKFPVVFATDSWTAIPNGGTPLVGTYRWYFENAATLLVTTKVASVGTAPATTPIQIRIKKNGSSIISGTSYPQINVGSNTQTNTPAYTSVAFASGDYCSVDIFQGDGASLLVKLWFTEP
jgi:hypothetical protein